MMRTSKEELSTIEKRENYTVSIVECGRTGMPQACLFADAGFKVIGINTNPHNLEMLKRGQAPFLKAAYRTLERHTKEGTFSVSSDIRKSVSESDVVVITVQIPIDSKKRPDYSAMEKTCKEVGMGLRKGSLVIFASPTGPGVVDGSLRQVMESTSGLRAGTDFGLAFGCIQSTLHENKSRVVVGAVNEPSLLAAVSIFECVADLDIAKVSSMKTAEAVSLFQNVKNELLQASSNELAFLCERLRIDSLEVLGVINTHSGSHFPLPGLVDASSRRDLCLLKEEAENADFDLRLIETASKINDAIVKSAFHLVRSALKACGKTVRSSKISVLGISRTPDAKDPPMALAKGLVALLKRKVRLVLVYDPYFSKKELAELGFDSEKLSKVVEKTDCLLILTGHSKFARLNLRKVRLVSRRSPALVDISHVISPSKAEQAGFVYRGLGRGVWTT